MLFVSESYQNYQNLAVSYQLTDVGKGESVLGVAMNLLMCDMIGALTVHIQYMPQSIIVSLPKFASFRMGIKLQDCKI
jgi:hypothetical protein